MVAPFVERFSEAITSECRERTCLLELQFQERAILSEEKVEGDVS